MALLTSIDSLDTTSIPTPNDYTIDGDLNKDKLITSNKYVQDTYVNKTAINPDRHPAIVSALLGYGEGSPISVVYFHNNDSKTSTASTSSDLVTRLHDVHQGWLQIRNFELKLQNSLDFEYDPETTVTTCVGKAYVYPGFNPNVGDQFLYTTDDNLIGLFKVNQVNRLSIKRLTYHYIEFELAEYVDEYMINEIENNIDKIVYFDKQRYLDSEGTLLYSEEYLLLKDIEIHKSRLIQHMVSKFFDTAYHYTFIRPDGVYDPYVTNFLSQIIGYSDIGMCPACLMMHPENKDFTIYNYLLNPKSIVKNSLCSNYIIPTFTSSLSNTLVNSLINLPYVKVVSSNTGDTSIDSVSEPYVLTTNFYNSTIDQYSAIENLIANYINNNKIDPNQLLNLINNYNQLNLLNQFYFIPVYLYLLNLLKTLI